MIHSLRANPGRVFGYALLSLLVIATFWLRLAHLGYSNYQGDEIKALCLPAAGQSLVDFLMGQRKGPIQFLITGAIGLFTAGCSNELIFRIPFACASVLSVYFFWHLIRLHFDEQIALYASLFFATNGFFVAFARIVQYQSVVVLCTTVSLYFLSLSIHSVKWRIAGLYIGVISAAIGILAHFDAIFVLPPALYLIRLWYVRSRENHTCFASSQKHLVIALILFWVLIGLFYIPYALSLTAYQLQYWERRMNGGLRHTGQIFKLYHSAVVLYVYGLLTLMALPRIRRNEPFLLIGFWLLPPLIFMNLMMQNPKTHIYTYFLPLMVLLAHGLLTWERCLQRFFSKAAPWLFGLSNVALFLFLIHLEHTIFVDHIVEYPTEPKPYLSWHLNRSKRLGTMGFPYRREWQSISAFLKTQKNEDNTLYITNEELKIATFYLPGEFKPADAQLSRNPEDGEMLYIILVSNPQSRDDTLLGRPASAWGKDFTPFKVFTNNRNKTLAAIYRLKIRDINLFLEKSKAY